MSAEAGAGDGPQSSLEPPDNPACPKSIPLCSLVEDGLYLAGSFYAVPCEVKSFWTDQDKSSGECLRCRKCRFTLCFASKIVPHTPGYSIAWWDTRWKEPEERLCQTSIFVEPTAWLFNQARALQGRLTCPSCHGKLGNYNWSGLYCECGACAQPGFHITPSKVDRAVGASEPVKAYLRHRHRPATSECGPAYSRLEEEPDDRENDSQSTCERLQDKPVIGDVELISACCQLEKQPESNSEQVCACSQLEDEQHEVHSFESALVANLHESNEEQQDGRGGEHPRTN
ncbi:hypothetical protein HPB49_017700 [Dermacentor silvarum]|uniref:Uncharacterized protein n=1 Tax=Dermacentor silvarum TaxID=543639 RepID=A0ACB8E1L4_DERSI|nr:hypothetical protein HPB49_017700 [Dermacentor silvarum]